MCGMVYLILYISILISTLSLRDRHKQEQISATFIYSRMLLFDFIISVFFSSLFLQVGIGICKKGAHVTYALDILHHFTHFYFLFV